MQRIVPRGFPLEPLLPDAFFKMRRGFAFYLNKTQKGQDDDLSAVKLFSYIRAVCFMSIIILTRIVLFDFYFLNHKGILWGDIFFELKYSLWGVPKETDSPRSIVLLRGRFI